MSLAGALIRPFCFDLKPESATILSSVLRRRSGLSAWSKATLECGPGPVASACFIWSRRRDSHPRFPHYRCGALATVLRRRRMVGAAGNAPASPRCRRGGLLLTYAPWSGSADLHRAFPVPQTGGTLPCPEPGRSPSGQPRVAYPRLAFRLVVVAASACHLPEWGTGPKPRPL